MGLAASSEREGGGGCAVSDPEIKGDRGEREKVEREGAAERSINATAPFAK